MPALKFSDETEYDESKSDYDDILKIAREYAKRGESVAIMKPGKSEHSSENNLRGMKVPRDAHSVELALP